VFGFFSLPELPQSNFGLLDQIAALGWVREHIGAFGGDPARVTMAGESAGASDIAHLVASPRAKGLFARAVMQSGGYSLRSRLTREDEFGRGLALARALGAQADADALARLRATSAADLQRTVDAQGLSDFDPVVDGDTVPVPAADAIAAGAGRGIDLLIGSNDDEWLSYLKPPLDEDAWLREHAPGNEQRLRDALSAERDPLRRMDLLETSHLFTCPSLWMAGEVAGHGARAWVYHFTRVRPGEAASRIGAYHGAEIPYVFGTHDAWLPTAAEDRELGARMMRYWTRFAAGGDPNGAGDPPWPAYRAEQPAVMQLDVVPRALAAHPSRALCAVLGPTTAP
jgi:para-nitrobenzyl esterase